MRKKIPPNLVFSLKKIYNRKDLKKEFFLAGGLDSENISRAIEEFDPYAVDLSSSLEVKGFKDGKPKEIDIRISGNCNSDITAYFAAYAGEKAKNFEAGIYYGSELFHIDEMEINYEFNYK